MIPGRRGLVTAGVVTLVLGLVVLFPARVAVHWFLPSDIAIGGIHGSAWRGGGSEASVNGLYLRDIQWNFAPLRLLTGNFSYKVSATPVSGFIESDLSIALNGTVSLSNVTASLPLELFAVAAGVPGLQGTASVQFERLEIVTGIPVAADGTLQIADLLVPLVGSDSLGGYKAEFFTQDNGISASIEDADGVVDLAGSLQLRPDRSYQFIAQVVMKTETPESVRRQLQYLPPANSRGQRELPLEGIL